MNLYRITITSDAGSISGDTVHISAASAKAAMDKAYKKYNKQFPSNTGMLVTQLVLVEQNY